MLFKILQALIGYAGSSEDPSKMSMRFMAILLAVLGKVVALAAAAGYVIPFATADLQMFVGSIAFVAAALFWVVGAVRAVIAALRK